MQPKEQIEKVREAFEKEFGRFNNLSSQSLTLGEAEGLLKELGELRVRHTGKKSAMMGLKKLIGQMATEEERRDFGTDVGFFEMNIKDDLRRAEEKLSSFIENARTESE